MSDRAIATARSMLAEAESKGVTPDDGLLFQWCRRRLRRALRWRGVEAADFYGPEIMLLAAAYLDEVLPVSQEERSANLARLNAARDKHIIDNPDHDEVADGLLKLAKEIRDDR